MKRGYKRAAVGRHNPHGKRITRSTPRPVKRDVPARSVGRISLRFHKP